MKPTPCTIAACAVLLLLLSSANPQAVGQPFTITQSYAVTLIQDPRDITFIFGLNNRDQAVGQNDNDGQGLIYDAGNFHEVSYPGAIQTEFRAINDRGDIVGKAQVGAGWVYFLYSRGSFAPLDVPGAPSDINNHGEIVGSYFDSSQRSHGYVYADGITQTIDVPNSTSTGVTGINDRGEMVGTYSTGQTRSAFVYSSGAFTPLSLPGAPQDINNRGQIVGSYYTAVGNVFGDRVFVYNQGSYDWFVVPESVYCDRGFIEMLNLAWAINDRGEVAGIWQAYSLSDRGGFIARPVHPIVPSELTVGTCHRTDPFP